MHAIVEVRVKNTSLTVLPVEAQKEEAFLQTRCSVFYKPGATARNSHIKERGFLFYFELQKNSLPKLIGCQFHRR